MALSLWSRFWAHPVYDALKLFREAKLTVASESKMTNGAAVTALELVISTAYQSYFNLFLAA